ncbi:MAG: CRTAC1 family protein [Planctomycetota bacterium]
MFRTLTSLLLLLGLTELAGCTPSVSPSQPPVVGPGRKALAPTSILTDETDASGIDFVHVAGETGELFLPEVMGAGCALFDYDNDGDLDLYLVQGCDLKPTPDIRRWRDRLYRNDLGSPGQAPRFTDVTEASSITGFGYGMGVATGDFNNDGHVDLYVTNLDSNQLLRNNGNGTFTDVTGSSGTDDPRWSTSATFFDYDRDGWLDLFVANYVDFSVDRKRECFAASSARDYCGPDAYNPVSDRLFHNLRDGTFEDVTRTSGIDSVSAAGLGVVAADLNGDGWTDLYVANDGDPNHLWINQHGSGAFVDEALLAGVALNSVGQAEAGMGVDAADFDGDGDDDLFVTNLERESSTIYVNLGRGLFEDRTIPLGLHAATLPYTSFGTRFFDYDNDGWLDLLLVNGAVRIIDEQARSGEARPLRMPSQLFRNTGRASFEDVTAQAGVAVSHPDILRGAAFGDIDNDGDTDVVVTSNGGRARLLLNQVGNRGHWLGLQLLEQGSGRDSLQARVEVIEQGGRIIWRRCHTDGSYCSAGDPRVLVGLGEVNQPPTVRVHWPAGTTEEWPSLAVDRYWTLRHGEGSVVEPTGKNGPLTRTMGKQ